MTWSEVRIAWTEVWTIWSAVRTTWSQVRTTSSAVYEPGGLAGSFAGSAAPASLLFLPNR
jgi:hypothetical protein